MNMVGRSNFSLHCCGGWFSSLWSDVASHPCQMPCSLLPKLACKLELALLSMLLTNFQICNSNVPSWLAFLLENEGRVCLQMCKFWVHYNRALCKVCIAPLKHSDPHFKPEYLYFRNTRSCLILRLKVHDGQCSSKIALLGDLWYYLLVFYQVNPCLIMHSFQKQTRPVCSEWCGGIVGMVDRAVCFMAFLRSSM